ncbi:NAD(P)/FAD-dependent oxidoreductase [Pseudonocardia sp.]|uniref:flavin-containing monooxygenase n=1 Tax=Pseudonocardia sp. TaxID=60912 RepID=UPI0026330CA6|nr:NAD(P)/FAD-dependent oxidoreductase [Pseudonocardia sp.]
MVGSCGPPVERREVVVVGTGFGGLAALIRLRGQGHDVLAVEQADRIGGTWRDNSYPGAGCDVPSSLYSYSFAPNPDWSARYAGQAEILDYLRRTADRFSATRSIRLGTRLLRGDWDEDERRWRLETSTGPISARWLVAAGGTLHEPAWPDLPGLDTFRGTVFHSSRWRHDHDLRGRRVAVVGSGASALQFVPRIAPRVRRLVLFQRSPQWVLPRFDRSVTGLERRLFRRFPAAQRVARLGVYLAAEAVALGVRHRWLRPQLTWLARRNLRRTVTDPALRARLLPSEDIGCRRLLRSNTWYPTLTRPDVTVAGDVREVRPGSVVDGDGREHAVDTLILATGFHAAEPPVFRLLHGADGASLAERFAATGARAHLGTTVAGAPNLFLLAGPNSTVQTSSVTVLEAQVDHVAAALSAARDVGADRVEVRPEVARAGEQEVRRRLVDTVWASGCRAWYLDRRGRNTTNWPGTTTELRRRLRRFDLASYLFDRTEREPSEVGPRDR